jgi:RNA polymerase sigma-70 factor, ECF subfamily
MTSVRADIELSIQTAIEAKDFPAAATRALEAYGREIGTFLFARLRHVDDCEDVFSIFVEDFWKSLPTFGFRCSMRVWMYKLARNAGIRYRQAAYRKRERMTHALGDSLSALIDRARTDTALHLRTTAKNKARAFRAQLQPDEQLLLTLHIDRGLPFRDVALVMSPGGEGLEPQALERAAARLRKRFERIKLELRSMAKREGLIG